MGITALYGRIIADDSLAKIYSPSRDPSVSVGIHERGPERLGDTHVVLGGNWVAAEAGQDDPWFGRSRPIVATERLATEATLRTYRSITRLVAAAWSSPGRYRRI